MLDRAANAERLWNHLICHRKYSFQPPSGLTRSAYDAHRENARNAKGTTAPAGATHKAVNGGAKVFGDWLLTLRGGLCHALVDMDVPAKGKKPARKPTEEERRGRRMRETGLFPFRQPAQDIQDCAIKIGSDHRIDSLFPPALQFRQERGVPQDPKSPCGNHRDTMVPVIQEFEKNFSAGSLTPSESGKSHRGTRANRVRAIGCKEGLESRQCFRTFEGNQSLQCPLANDVSPRGTLQSALEERGLTGSPAAAQSLMGGGANVDAGVLLR